MKNILTLALMVVTLYGYSQQDSTGIYLNANDFKQQKLSHSTDCKSPKHEIKFQGKSTVTVVNQKETIKFKKSSVYGVKLCDKKTYRFVKDNDYRVINSQKIYLYERVEITGTGISETMEDLFFFSTDAESNVIRLTSENLKKAYPKNIRFHDLLDSRFKSESELSEFDNYMNKYKLVHAFEESLETK